MKVTALCSGGMDSATLLYWLKENGHNIHAIGFNYGQRHGRELLAAQDICDDIDVQLTVVDVSDLKRVLRSSQTSEDIPVPEGHYTDESMRATVVPNRNMIMLSIAAGLAISRKDDALAYGCHAGDHTIYPDCRLAFVQAMRDAFQICDWHSLDLLTPWVDKTKTDIARYGALMGVPFEKTWSCYKGLAVHCGKCGTCVERIEALEEAGLEDKTIYDV